MTRGCILASALAILSAVRPGPVAAQSRRAAFTDSRIDLDPHWMIQSSASVPHTGETAA